MPTRARWWQLSLTVLLALLVGLAGLAAGRWWGSSAAHPSSGYDRGYRAGLDAGEAQGIEQGRALQAGLSVRPSDRTAARAAFRSGYAAGANDVFGTYDGGWELGRPYAVVLAPGADGVTYRIARREQLPPGCRP